jgi:hypothetical protein
MYTRVLKAMGDTRDRVRVKARLDVPGWWWPRYFVSQHFINGSPWANVDPVIQRSTSGLFFLHLGQDDGTTEQMFGVNLFRLSIVLRCSSESPGLKCLKFLLTRP